MSSWVSQTKERNGTLFWWNSSRYFCTGSFARWQQGEQNCSSVAGVGVFGTPHLTNITEAL